MSIELPGVYALLAAHLPLTLTGSYHSNITSIAHDLMQLDRL